MKMKKLQSITEYDPEWIKETVKVLNNNNVNNLSEYQRKILRDQYLENLRDGLKPKEAIEKALKIISCFN